jgi:hypothetical protein
MGHALAECERAIGVPESAARRGLDFVRNSMTRIMLAARGRGGRGGERGRSSD